MTLYVFTTEFVGPKHRGMAGTLTWMFFSMSLMVLCGLAYGIREWRTLSVVVSAPAIPLIVLWRQVKAIKTSIITFYLSLPTSKKYLERIGMTC